MKKLSAKNKLVVNKAIASINKIANYVEYNYKAHGWSQKKALNTALQLDRIAELLEDTIQEDWHDEVDYLTSPDGDMDYMEWEADEPYMDTFTAPTAVQEVEADEESYMDWYNSNDNMEVMEYIHEDRREEGNPVLSSKRTPTWKDAARFFQATEESDEEEAEDMDHDEEHEARRRAFKQAQARRQRSRGR
jgi:hypothetical protein